MDTGAFAPPKTLCVLVYDVVTGGKIRVLSTYHNCCYLIIHKEELQMDSLFLREKMLLGADAMTRLDAAHVIVFGLGGVGSWAAEALVRSGIGEITLVDHDTVGESNINRQLGALHSTLGMPKAEALAARLRDINPQCRIHVRNERYSADVRESFFEFSYSYIIDAIDIVTCKLDLIQTALSRGVPIISALGTGNKLDPTCLTICDISKTYNCPLAKVIRKELRYRGIRHHQVVFSPEEKLYAEQVEAPPEGRRSVPGSVVWVPACAGLMLAGHVVQALAMPAEVDDQENQP